ncbi:hypothetical protein [Pokkaliibacter plantistimulans]|uniref:hypothetical protein n=1 Tax=Pokkaliibacter plantistimulans TaxID=1635171 RepID=UPI0011B0D514|nr:hypothetical protein [Pokkaliibacter plantistimulans]
MPGAPQDTELSKVHKTVVNTTVIEFLLPPVYRNRQVDISLSNKAELLSGPVVKWGSNRVTIPNLTQTGAGQRGECSVIVSKGTYLIHYSYSGSDVSEGVVEV